MTELVRIKPCSACPYRRDVPSGVWINDEYDKLRPYDNPTHAQPFEGFACHATPEYFCHGWAVVHSNRGHEHMLLSLRVVEATQGHPVVIPDAVVPLFGSAAQAADYGQRDVMTPSPAAGVVANKLVRQHAHLRRSLDES